jgi:glutamate-5-semialdehyde dehydrogenase
MGRIILKEEKYTMVEKKIDIEEIKTSLDAMGERAVFASRMLTKMSSAEKDECLETIAVQIEKDKGIIIEANGKDMDNGIKTGLSSAMIDRLRIDEKRIIAMSNGLRELIKLEDPVGRTITTTVRPNGLEIKKVSVPIGVIAIIYESRPNVTVDAAGLCIKSGNAVILRGGSESINSNLALAHCITRACMSKGIDKGIVQLLPWINRNAVDILLKMDNYIDLVIPRGGEDLIRKIVQESTIPVIKHYKGICNVYIDSTCNEKMALDIVENAKCQRPGVCNAAETLLIHQDIAEEISPKLADILIKNGVELRGDTQFCGLVPSAKKATEEDWSTEYLDLIISIKIVPHIQAAIDHINMYGSQHSDLIITDNCKNAEKFMKEVDTSTVYHNASTRFTDGYEFGMGAEIGISTDKIHARGPMGLKELNTYKYLVFGNGQIRQ